MPGIGAPENITIEFLSANTVKVSWATSTDIVEKYDVNYKPTNARYGKQYCPLLISTVRNKT